MQMVVKAQLAYILFEILACKITLKMNALDVVVHHIPTIEFEKKNFCSKFQISCQSSRNTKTPNKIKFIQSAWHMGH